MMRNLVSLAVTLLQMALLVAIAPGLNGLIKCIKAHFQRRVGPPLIQGYRDLAKLFSKETIHAYATSPIFRLAPAVSFGATLVAAAAFPCVLANPMRFSGDVLTAIYLLGLGRFFVALGGLDAASAFGGLGSSRDMAISSMAEPVAMVCILVLAAGAGRPTDGAALATAGAGASLLAPWRLLAACAFFLVVLAECARVPVDNPATHLELTMVHEVMVLDHSGPDLAAIQLGAAVKLTIGASIIATLLNPWAGTPGPLAAGVNLALAVGVAVVAGTIGSLVARLRLRAVPQYVVVALASSVVALLASGWRVGGAP
jgi:formate hydrogenlyase subunit 4